MRSTVSSKPEKELIFMAISRAFCASGIARRYSDSSTYASARKRYGIASPSRLPRLLYIASWLSPDLIAASSRSTQAKSLR
jgi:hypothetical protein